MAGINKVTLIGHLGADPDIKHLPDGTQIANLRIATSERWRDKTTGEVQERTEWHRVSLFGKVAEIAGQYLSKGSQVYLEGKLRTRKWQDSTTGQDRYVTEVVLSGPQAVMQMLSSRADATTAPASATPYRQPKTQAQQAASAAVQAPGSPLAGDFDDDIPF